MDELMEYQNVLIIDDELGMRMGAERVLKNTLIETNSPLTQIFFNVDSIGSYKEYEELQDKSKYDLVLLDYKLPDGVGIDILNHIKTIRPDVFVIMITAYATFEMAVQATKRGAYDFLAKPFTPDELRDSIRKAATHMSLAKRAKKFEAEKQKIRFQFISVLAHELKAPLNAIEGYLNILSDSEMDVTIDDRNLMIQRSRMRVEGMRKLIFDLLDMTRIESGEKQRNISLIDVKEILNNSIEMFMLEAKNKGISIEYIYEGNLTTQADKSELEIVFNNLISNAVKYNKEHGTVKITAMGSESQIIFKIQDTGIGIKKEDQERLFHDFVRIKNDKTRDILGSGLGLSTVRKICKLYGGDIKLTSEFGVGSTFEMSINKILKGG